VEARPEMDRLLTSSCRRGMIDEGGANSNRRGPCPNRLPRSNTPSWFI
jgi:hypothetical protein